MNEKERKSCIFTIKTLMNLAYNIHGVMDVVDVDNCKKIIEMLDSGYLAGRWIPVSERLPEEGEVVLTQAKFKDDVKMAVSSRIDYNYWTAWGTRDINIIAWLPLPEPYQEGGAE